ncbi:hypothetical protein EPN29_10950 [bacterium]|nr:MAG: hypothetical protein EPN29_10950 [bacterium]
MSACDPYRQFVAALADGEAELVPAATLDHVEHCADCSREVQAHRLLTSRLREASEHLDGAAPRRPRVWVRTRRSAAIAAAAAALLAVAAVAAVWSGLSRPDPVQAAVAASSQPLQIQSTDPSQVGEWCFRASGRGLPAIQLDGMRVIGARMDRVPSTDIVTVVYSAPAGERVSVSWLEGQAPVGSGVETRSASVHPVLIVHSALGTAVITGSSSAVMWKAAAAIESTATWAQLLASRPQQLVDQLL